MIENYSLSSIKPYFYSYTMIVDISQIVNMIINRNWFIDGLLDVSCLV